MEDYLSKLNGPQREAVEYIDGPELVIAGAGSGKTRVLTYKIVHLLAHDYEPWRIMALTFTNKAAREMRSRIETLVGEKTASKLWMGTFHSIFSKILHINASRIGYRSDFTIYDTSDSKSLIKMIIRDMKLDENVYQPAAVLNSISTAKNALVSPEAYAMDRELIDSDRRSKRPATVEIYHAYRDRCRVAGAMDFDDLLFYTDKLLRENPDVLRHYQEFFRYILVDEYQDTNYAQHVIVRRLTEESGKLCVVGDDAQSIYSFRGANIRNILDLKKSYANLRIFKLEQNYRSTQNIINAANTLIAKNMMQIPKNVFSTNDIGERIEVVQCYSVYEEGYLVANRISQLHMKNHDSYDDYAILYRTNAQSRVLEESLRRRNIPYRIYGGVAFYQRKEVKDVVSYLRLAVNPHDDEALKRVINVPARGIGETTVGKLSSAAIDNGVSIWEIINNLDKYPVNINKGTTAKIAGFATLIQTFNNEAAAGMNADELTQKVIADSRLLAMYLSDTTPESITKHENINELLNAARVFVYGKQDFDDITLHAFLSEVSLATDQDEKDDSTAERITLMTIHAAKGLEFSNVFIVGVEERLIPSPKSASTKQGLEEERRLLYVAITRAKNYCMLSYAPPLFPLKDNKENKLNINIPIPSRFISDIDRKFLRLATGTQIAPPKSNVPDYHTFRERYAAESAPRAGVRSFAPAQDRAERPSPSRFGIPTEKKAGGVPIGQARPAGEYDVHTSDSLTLGMTIEHQRFGRGKITSIDTSTPDHKITVEFENVQVRVLLLKFARFKIISE